MPRLQSLFAQNHEINETSTSLDGKTALHLAVELGRADMIKFLVYNYADVNLATRAKLEVGQEFGNTALNIGVMGGKKEIVSLLISLSADPNGSCEVTNTPLNTAIQIWGVRYDQEIVHALCQAKADVSMAIVSTLSKPEEGAGQTSEGSFSARRGDHRVLGCIETYICK